MFGEGGEVLQSIFLQIFSSSLANELSYFMIDYEWEYFWVLFWIFWVSLGSCPKAPPSYARHLSKNQEYGSTSCFGLFIIILIRNTNTLLGHVKRFLILCQSVSQTPLSLHTHTHTHTHKVLFASSSIIHYIDKG